MVLRRLGRWPQKREGPKARQRERAAERNGGEPAARKVKGTPTMEKKNPKRRTISPHPEAIKLLEAWDRGEPISTVELGGLGPGYEQAIQVLAVEIVRDNIGQRLPVATDKDFGEDTLHRLSEAERRGEAEGMGFSGAQFGKARALAYAWLTRGVTAVLKEVQTDRRILASRTWPHLKAQGR